MKAYKGFDKNLKCRGFQYKVGKTYEEKDAKLCETGFHACEAPLNVMDYYPPHESRYCEVELDNVSEERGNDTKVVGKKITIGAEIGIPGLVKAHVEWVKEQVKECDELAKIGSSGDDVAVSCERDHAVAVCAGKNARIKGPVGTWIALAEYGEYDGEGYPCVGLKAAMIDGEKLKADTWYRLKDGEFVEVEDNDAG